MPSDKHLHTPGGITDRDANIGDFATTTPKRGLAGAAGGPVDSGTNIADNVPLGTSLTAAPTGVSAADHVGNSGQVDVTFTFPAGITTVEVVVLKHSDGSFVKKADFTASPAAVTGLVNNTAYDFYVRGVGSDGSVGRFAAVAAGTPTAS